MACVEVGAMPARQGCTDGSFLMSRASLSRSRSRSRSLSRSRSRSRPREGARVSVDVPRVIVYSFNRLVVVVVDDETWMVGDVHAIEHGAGDVDVERGGVPRRGRRARVVVGGGEGDGEGVVKHPSFKVCGV